MIDEFVYNSKSPKYYVKKYLESIRRDLRDKTIIDLPAGNGATSEILHELGARVEPYDLFPEYFMLPTIECRRADIGDGLPVAGEHADMVVCQEGMEHFSDQLKALREFNRVLKMQGKLLITTPSYSSLASRFSYLLFESETARRMPPNEIDDIWMSDKSLSGEIYHGHIFLIGLQRLRILARLSGFKISRIKYMRLSRGSLLLFPFFYPWILVSSCRRYRRCLRKHKEVPMELKTEVYREQLKINLSPKNLLNRHTFIIFEKEKNWPDVDFRHESIIKPFKKIM